MTDLNDSNKTVARAIIGGSYLVAATVMFAGIGIAFAGNDLPNKSGYLFLGGIFLAMVFFYFLGVRTLNRVSQDLRD
jgi:hypothetical protein